MKKFAKKLNDLKAQARYRSLSLPHGIDLTSNDYLGLKDHPALRAAAIGFLQSGGDIGAGGSRLLRGHTDAHAALEEYAARYFAAEKTLFFATGFQANMALFTTLPGRHDTIIFDELIHASARDGIQSSHARHIKVQHNNLSEFEAALEEAQGQRWIAVESIYSMDGDAAPLQQIYDLAVRYDAMLIIDEAHATGVLGTDGKGLAYGLYASLRGGRSPTRQSSLDSGLLRSARNDGFPDNLITLHTCGKAIGVAGGLVCASSDVIDMLINTARPFMYSTAPLPLQAHLVQQSLQWIGSAEGECAREKLHMRCAKAQQFFGGPGTHIVPIMLGSDERAVGIAQMLQQKGYDIRAIRPPTVPENTARLRLSLSASLDEKTLHDFAAALMPLLQDQAA